MEGSSLLCDYCFKVGEKMKRSRTVNRGWLRRMVAAGNVLARTSYSFDEMTGEKIGDEWIPARISTGYDDFKPGMYNLSDWYFKSHGHAWRNDDGVIELYVHSNLCIAMQVNPKLGK
jgi:hypothetical protein